MEVKIDLRKSLTENASGYYEKAKKARAKIEGAEKAVKKTHEDIEWRLASRIIPDQKIIKKRVEEKKAWYEKFRWFFTSSGFLVIGGKDATSNEVVIKKYTEENDLVFHADVQGAPFFVLKNPDKKEVPENDLKEAAQAAASYSSAWKSGTGICDVYCVRPGQVSKTPPSGEYIAKGAFMIYGKKQWFRGVEMKLAVGVKIDEKTKVIAGPVDEVKKNSIYAVQILTGEKKSGELAKEIKNVFLKKCGREDAKKIKRLDVESIQHWIPGGRGRILDST